LLLFLQKKKMFLLFLKKKKQKDFSSRGCVGRRATLDA